MPARFPQDRHELPPAPLVKRLIGPSFILLGLGLGSGEIILWPYLTSQYGLGLIWGIVIGVTLQFFINMEVERYALVNGESIFVGFARWLRFLPLWFILSTFLGFGWPGIGLAGATLLFKATDLSTIGIVSVFLFIGIGVLLSVGKHLYHTVETLQKFLILVGSPFILILTFILARSLDWQSLFLGFVGIGPDYRFLPADISMASLLGAIAFSGAGGNLNLAQSFYIRDKGYGMGQFAQKISNLFTSDTPDARIKLSGSTFPLSATNLSRFRTWWRNINLEHLLVFWVLGLITMVTLAFLAYITAYAQGHPPSGIDFVITEAATIGSRLFPFIGTLFLFITGLMLTATQLTVLDSTSRIITENLILLKGQHLGRVSHLYYTVLWIQIAFAIAVILLGFTQPRQLITLSAVINAFTMFVYIALILYLNNRRLPTPLRPTWFRNSVLLFAFLFFGLLCTLTLFPSLLPTFS